MFLNVIVHELSVHTSYRQLFIMFATQVDAKYIHGSQQNIWSTMYSYWYNLIPSFSNLLAICLFDVFLKILNWFYFAYNKTTICVCVCCVCACVCVCVCVRVCVSLVLVIWEFWSLFISIYQYCCVWLALINCLLYNSVGW